MSETRYVQEALREARQMSPGPVSDGAPSGSVGADIAVVLMLTISSLGLAALLAVLIV